MVLYISRYGKNIYRLCLVFRYYDDRLWCATRVSESQND